MQLVPLQQACYYLWNAGYSYLAIVDINNVIDATCVKSHVLIWKVSELTEHVNQ